MFRPGGGAPDPTTRRSLPPRRDAETALSRDFPRATQGRAGRLEKRPEAPVNKGNDVQQLSKQINDCRAWTLGDGNRQVRLKLGHHDYILSWHEATSLAEQLTHAAGLAAR